MRGVSLIKKIFDLSTHLHLKNRPKKKGTSEITGFFGGPTLGHPPTKCSFFETSTKSTFSREGFLDSLPPLIEFSVTGGPWTLGRWTLIYHLLHLITFTYFTILKQTFQGRVNWSSDRAALSTLTAFRFLKKS